MIVTVVTIGVIIWCAAWLAWDYYADVKMIERRYEHRYRMKEEARRSAHPEWYEKHF